MGARAMSLGFTSSCLTDEWSIFNNVGGLAKVKQPSASFSYTAYPHSPFFDQMAALYCKPIKFGVLAGGIYRFGDDLYNEHIISGAFANSFGLASLGIKLNYIQYHAEGFGSTQALTVSFGGVAELSPQILVGAHIVNINQPKLSETSKERVPTRMTMGIGFRPNEKVFLSSEVEKDLAFDLTWKTGFEYQVHKKLVARTGFNLNPQAGFAGIGFKPKKFSLDYAFQYSTNLGGIHQATVSYQFKSK
jgi:hypothetical protein